jgi:hypothetical protein
MTDDDLTRAWDEFCDGLRESGRFVFDASQPADDVDRAEGLRHVLRSLMSAVGSAMENSDAGHPELGWVYPSKIGQDNPDGLYQIAPVDLRHGYRLSGDIGSVRYLGLTLMTFNFGDGPVEQLLTINGDALPTDADGRFTVVFSSNPAPPGCGPGEWYELPPARCRLLVRQFFADWEHETPADLHLECLDPGGPAARLAPADVVGRLDVIGRELREQMPFWNAYARGHLDRGEVNTFDHMPARNAAAINDLGGSVEQAYGQCWYRLGDDDALVYEVAVPECRYWNVQLGDIWFQSLDWVNHQSSLNDHQAVLDDDGVFRAVVSHRDPGIANWLDTAGTAQGCITYRWNQATTAPVPTLRLVSFAELDAHLPPGTERVSPAQRADTLARRRRAALARFRR